ncbi:hypothetical protein [Falsiroseomonas tokyonensis]|uniref:Uncharacterized protein n=1 Tax=Falsiroseomonas tokyonensis TaxID=430521 RepID=A0ABV7BX51_9PROT|nr:hypothetical protein [Falsiroseomonas tokyonensis]MBU8540192.1 hypothetical protein [Falsiroseomonas tokyonensis]
MALWEEVKAAWRAAEGAAPARERLGVLEPPASLPRGLTRLVPGYGHKPRIGVRAWRRPNEDTSDIEVLMRRAGGA